MFKKSTPLGMNEGAKRDVECHGAGKVQGQHSESYLSVKHTLTNAHRCVLAEKARRGKHMEPSTTHRLTLVCPAAWRCMEKRLPCYEELN